MKIGIEAHASKNDPLAQRFFCGSLTFLSAAERFVVVTLLLSRRQTADTDQISQTWNLRPAGSQTPFGRDFE
jgi:hypothetical protein